MKYVISSITRWLYGYLSWYSLLQWYLLSCFLMCLTCASWYIIFFLPTCKRIGYYTSENSLKNKDVVLSIDCQAACTQTGLRLRALQHDVDLISSHAIDHNFAMVVIIKHAKALRLEIDSCVSSKMIDYDWHAVMPFTVTVRGSLNAICSWLKAVTQELKLSTVKQLTVNHEQAHEFLCSCTFFLIEVKKSPSTLRS